MPDDFASSDAIAIRLRRLEEIVCLLTAALNSSQNPLVWEGAMQRVNTLVGELIDMDAHGNAVLKSEMP
jgi:hypothetical protein